MLVVTIIRGVGWMIDSRVSCMLGLLFLVISARLLDGWGECSFILGLGVITGTVYRVVNFIATLIFKTYRISCRSYIATPLRRTHISCRSRIVPLLSRSWPFSTRQSL